MDRCHVRYKCIFMVLHSIFMVLHYSYQCSIIYKPVEILLKAGDKSLPFFCFESEVRFQPY